MINSQLLLGPEKFITALKSTSQISSVHTQIPCLFEAHFHVIIPSASISANLFLSLRLYTAKLYASDAGYMFDSSRTSRFDLSYSAWRHMQIFENPHEGLSSTLSLSPR
jgi:hypothetical protein